jgi:hypothetical protein
LAAFSTVRVAARTFLPVLRIVERAWRFTALIVLRVARAALRAVLRALPVTLRTLRRAFTCFVTVLAATFRRATLTFLRAGRRLLCTERRRADFLAFFLAAMGFLLKMQTPMGIAGCDTRASS